jgi:hypothetical protein
MQECPPVRAGHHAAVYYRQIMPQFLLNYGRFGHIFQPAAEDRMPVLHNAGSYVIAMYFEDHNPPHVHVVGPDFEGLVAIADLAVFRGSIPPRFSRAALGWIAENRGMLADKWEEWH